jgi:hypothetical protein
MKKKARRSTAKKKSKPKRPPEPDASQTSLAMVEHIIGGKLANGMRTGKQK